MTDRDEQGAVAVEFALLLPLLVVLLTAIVDYGLWFSDSISLRQGAREGARQAAVGQYDTCTTGDVADRTACIVRDRTGALGGDLAVHVYAPGNWQEDSKVVVCTAIKEDGITGLTPLPGDAVLRTKATMRIEVDQSTTGGATYDDDDDPSGQGLDDVVLRRDDAGALAIIVALFATAMFAFGALVIEVGGDREARRSAQSAADAAALAAAHTYDETGGDLDRAFAEATEYAYDNFPADRQRSDYWDGCEADPVGGGTWVSVGGTSCVLFREGASGRHTRVQVVVPGVETSRLLGAVAGKVRALAQARIPGLADGNPFSCELCVTGTFDSNGHLVSVDGLARIFQIINSNGLNATQVAGPPVVVPPQPPAPVLTAQSVSNPCQPGVYVNISACNAFVPGGEYIVTSGVNTIDPASNPTNVLFYFTSGATLGISDATVVGKTSGPYEGYAFIFDSAVPAQITMGPGNEHLTVDGAFYAPSVEVIGTSGTKLLEVNGPMAVRNIALGGGSAGVTIGQPQFSTFPPISTGTLGLAR